MTERDLALDEAFLAAQHALIAEHLEQDVAREPWVQTVEYDASIPRRIVANAASGSAPQIAASALATQYGVANCVSSGNPSIIPRNSSSSGAARGSPWATRRGTQRARP